MAFSQQHKWLFGVKSHSKNTEQALRNLKTRLQNEQVFITPRLLLQIPTSDIFLPVLRRKGFKVHTWAQLSDTKHISQQLTCLNLQIKAHKSSRS